MPFELWAEKLNHGQHLVTPSVRHIPPESIDPKIKSRSRLHWYLADQQARLADPHAAALILDRDANIAETSSGNFLIARKGTIYTPGHHSALGGVSQQVVMELAAGLGIDCVAGDLKVYDVLNADEAFTSSTPYCLLPVTRLNGRTIGNATPGPLFRKLMTAWNELVGLDVAEQIHTVASQRSGDA